MNDTLANGDHDRRKPEYIFAEPTVGTSHRTIRAEEYFVKRLMGGPE